MFVIAYLKAMVLSAAKAVGWLLALRGSIIAAITAVAGSRVVPLSSNDLASIGLWLLIGVALWFLIELLVLTPARHWRDSKSTVLTDSGLQVSGIQLGTKVTIAYERRGDGIVQETISTELTETASGTAVSPEEPQSPERSTHD